MDFRHGRPARKATLAPQDLVTVRSDLSFQPPITLQLGRVHVHIKILAAA